MSFQNFRKHTSSKQNERIKQLLTRLDKFERDQNPLEDDSLKALGFTDHGRISYHDELAFSKVSNITETAYKCCIEPNGTSLTLWYTFDGLTQLEDKSMWGHIGTVFGNSTCGVLAEGLDEGFGAGGNICMKFDGSTRYIKVNHDAIIDASNGTGYSMFMRIKPVDTSSRQILFEKIDDINGANGYKAILEQDQLIFIVSENSIKFTVTTGTGVISPNNWYDCWFVFDNTLNTVKIYVNNVGYTNPISDGGFSSGGFSAGGFDVTPNLNFGSFTTNGTALIIGSSIDNTEFYSGYIQDMRFWNSKVVTTTEVSNMWTNKLTISNIAFGNTAVVGYSIIPAAKKRVANENIPYSESFNVAYLPTNPKIRSISESSISVSDNVTPLKNPIKIRTVMESTNISDSVSVLKQDLKVKIGNIVKSTQTSGLPFTDTTYTNALGFAPKFIIFFGTFNSSYNVFNGDDRFIFGFTNGANSRCASTSVKDAASTSESAHMLSNDAVIKYIKYDESVECKINCSFTTNGFNLNYVSNNNANYIINYIAFGGSQLSDVHVGDFDQPSTTTGNYSVTGLGFQPDLNIFSGIDLNELNNGEPDQHFSFGMAKSSTERFAYCITDDNNLSTTDTKRSSRSDRAIHILNSGSGTIIKSADFVSNDADGFTLNYATASGFADKVIFASLKGITCKIGKFALSSGNGLQSVTGIGFKPRLVIFTGIGLPVDVTDTSNSESKISFGAVMDTLNRRSIGIHNKNNEDTSVVVDYNRSDKCFSLITANSSSENSTQDILLDISTMDSDGFTVNKSSNDNITMDIFYLAIK